MSPLHHQRRRSLIRIAAVGTVALVALTPTTSSAAPSDVGLRAGESLVFSSTRSGGTSDLYRLDPAGTITRLTSVQADDTQPAVSPDGATVAFTRSAGQSATPSGGDLYLIDVDGSRERALLVDSVSSDFRPAWSPDGSRLVFSRLALDGMSSSIWTVAADGSGLRQLTTAPGQNNYASYAGDDRIVLNSNRDGTFKIWEMAIDGTSARPITTGPDTGPAVSRDGTRIAFRSQRSATGIWVMDVAGTTAQQLTTSDDKFPSWSPDSSRIVFARRDAACPANAGTFCPHTLTVADVATGRTADVAPATAATDLFSAFAGSKSSPEAPAEPPVDPANPGRPPAEPGAPANLDDPAAARELPVTGRATDAAITQVLLALGFLLRKLARHARQLRSCTTPV